MRNVAIFGAPRSGTSWLGQIFNSSSHVCYRFQPLFSYAFKDNISLRSTEEDFGLFYKNLIHTDDAFVLQTENVSGKKGLAFTKASTTHLVWKEVRYHYLLEHIIKSSDTQIIGLVRHPCAVINSWLQAPKEFKDKWKPLEEWRKASKKNQDKKEEYNGYNKWKELTQLYLKLEHKYPEKFKIQVYETLNDNTELCVKALFDFVGLNLEKQTLEFIKESKSLDSIDAYGIHRKEQDSFKWKKQLMWQIQEAILSDPEFIDIDNYFKWR